MHNARRTGEILTIFVTSVLPNLKMFNLRVFVLSLYLIATCAFSPIGTGRFARSALSMSEKAKMPAAPTSAKSGKDIVATAVGTGSHKTLVAALQAAKLDSVLSGKGPFTVFAPTDAAFAKLPAGTVDALLKDIPKLTAILQYHVSTNQQLPSRNGRAYVTLNVDKDGDAKEVGVLVTVDTCESFIKGGQANKAKVSATVQATNGYVHVIDEVLLPYEGKEPPYMAIKEPIPSDYQTPKI
jgi:uncharacterized surface protein with fasciclin (FAS1) repeats